VLRFKVLLLAFVALGALTPAFGQAVEAPTAAADPEAAADGAADPAGSADEFDEEDEFEGEEVIVVTGQRLPGEVRGDIKPEIQLDRRDIRSYGVSSVGELVEALAPQTGSGRGRGDGAPVILVNGRRISSFREIRDLPPEAIVRVDIFPEEVALKYGYRADQRVMNFVLRRRFQAVTGELEGGVPTEGGRTSYEADANIVRIDGAGRWAIDAEYQRDTSLLESERDIVQAVGGEPFDLIGNIAAPTLGEEIDPALSALLGETVTVAGVPVAAASGAPSLGDFSNEATLTDQRRFRTLLPDTEQYSINGTLNRNVFGNVAGTLNASWEQSRSTSRLGLPEATFLIPAGNPFSPFSADVDLYRLFEAPRPLTREASSRTGHLGLALNGDLSRWQWSLTANYDNVRSVTRTDRELDLGGVEERIATGDPTFNPFAPIPVEQLAFGQRDRARSTDQFGNAELVANGSPFALPAGDVSTSFKLGGEARRFDSESSRGGFEQTIDLSRDEANASANIDLPIASRRNAVLDAIGDLSANANFAIEELSDFGSLITYGYGVTWSPLRQVQVIASVTEEDGAPSVQQLGNPIIAVPNVRVFDFVRGETVDITRIEGGNPDLLADHRSVFKLGVSVKPLGGDTDLTIRADYNRSRTRNLIASFPTATAEIEAAFPQRFVRDADGRLVSIDARPVNFARASSQEIRWGFYFSKPIASRRPAGGWRGRGGEGGRRRDGGSPDAPAPSGETPTSTGESPSVPGAAPAQAPPAEAPPPATPREAWRGRDGGTGGFGRGGGRGGLGPGGFGRGGPGQGGRINLALFHTWRLQDEVLIRPGVDELDFLDGSAVGNSGGRPQHQIELQAGIFKNGFGARLAANWQSATTVEGNPGTGGGDGSSDLRFSDLATVNLRLFSDLGQQPSLVRKHPWLRGTRVSLAVDNLFNSRMEVRDASGVTPLSYQPAYLDPLGRSVRISLRKMFF
jgi:hypothetical protein